MNILVLDGVRDPASVTLYRENKIDRREMTPRTKLSEQLLPTIATLLKSHDLDLGDVSRIGVVNEPASFTSLRITIAAANALAYGSGIELVSLTADEAAGDDVAQRVMAHSSVRQLLPDYGRPARVTRPIRR